MIKKGQSGNIKGRPKGAINRKTRTLRMLFEGEAEDLIRKAIEKAKEGDIQALKLCLERILPPVKDIPINLDISEVIDETASSVLAFSREVIKAVTRGEITPSEGDLIVGMLDKYGRTIEMDELDKRISSLEESLRKRGAGL